jgi:hypothetical protein
MPTEKDEGVQIVGKQKKGVVIIDKNTKTEPPKVELSQGEGDRDS